LYNDAGFLVTPKSVGEIMYTAEISRNNPSMILFLLDQSGSMQEVFDPENVQAMKEPVVADGKTFTHTASGPTKAQALADAINKLLQNLCIKCSRGEGGVWDYFHVGVIGYGMQVGPAFAGSLSGRELVPISEVAGMPARVEKRTKKVSDGAGGLVDQEVKFPIWFDAVANGGTPMYAALQEARRIIQDWLSTHPNCFPPVVINITDGESSDENPASAAAAVRALSSSDGEVLLFNLHLSAQRNRPIEFPSSDAGLPDHYAKLLYQMSSPLTPFMITVANQQGFHAADGARGFVFNAKLEVAIQFLDIGTRPSNLR
jgi:hypothetical protein